MSVTNNTQVGIPKVPGLSDTEQAVLSAIVAEAVRLGRWSSRSSPGGGSLPPVSVARDLPAPAGGRDPAAR